jgi:hypothetical protein
MFRATYSPILRSTFDCIYSFWYNAPTLLPTGDTVNCVTGRSSNDARSHKHQVPIITKISHSWYSKTHVSEMNHKSRQSDRYSALKCQTRLFLFTYLMPHFTCGFCNPKTDTACSISIRQKRNSSRLPAEFGAGNIQDRFARKRNSCCINLVKCKECCVLRHILFHPHDGWALYLFPLHGLKHRPL